jgi:hypothetical protein
MLLIHHLLAVVPFHPIEVKLGHKHQLQPIPLEGVNIVTDIAFAIILLLFCILCWAFIRIVDRVK